MDVLSPKSEVSFHCRIAVKACGIFNKLLVFQRGGCGENSDLAPPRSEAYALFKVKGLL
jgi:hypothetical protein